ncbi:elongation factor-like GTPase 1, partial [Saccoglossus kowalevskii]|uniref:Elongation factor Tu GTP-binding domain-containing protein 1-like n=1 Tax=Saccoglossus kowalevskii TaxID=10224 RepID=A0ABM0M3B3_SACKO
DVKVSRLVAKNTVAFIIDLSAAFCYINVISVDMPKLVKVTELLENNSELIKILVKVARTSHVTDKIDAEQLSTVIFDKIVEFKNKLTIAFKEAGKKWRDVMDQIWTFGPKHCGPNILLNTIPDYKRPSIWECINTSKDKTSSSLNDYDNSVMSGFQLATLAGPMCEEPMMGVCFALEEWKIKYSKSEQKGNEIAPDSDSGGQHSSCTEENGTQSRTRMNIEGTDRWGPFSGQLISTVKESCRVAFQAKPQRLKAAMYKCDIQTTADVLGRMYAVLGKRNGRVFEEEMKEGSTEFMVRALLPVAESFGFAEEIRKRTSGQASPQLFFSHWETDDVPIFRNVIDVSIKTE